MNGHDLSYNAVIQRYLEIKQDDAPGIMYLSYRLTSIPSFNLQFQYPTLSMSDMPLLSYVPISVRTRALVSYLSVHVLLILLQERGVRPIQLCVTVLN